MLKLFRSKIYVAVLLLTVLVSTGVLGYRFISGYSWIDAVYMTTITVSTVGFGEVSPMDTGDRIFTVFLIVSSIFILGYTISVISEYLIGQNRLQSVKKKRVKSKIDQLVGHIVICGFGRNGMQAVQRLQAYKKPFVIIEKDKELIEKFEESYLFVEGDGNDDEVLMAAGIERAKYLIVTFPDDASNLFVVLSARQINPKLYIISRASFSASQKKLLLAGANKVIMPDKIGGDHMASLVVMPDLITFMDKLSTEGGHTTNLEEVSIEDFAGQTDCSSLKELDLRKKTGCTIIGYISPSGDYIINPEADLKLEPQGKLIVLGRPEQINKLNKMFHID